jgi:two-component system, sensor histidine kinase
MERTLELEDALATRRSARMPRSRASSLGGEPRPAAAAVGGEAVPVLARRDTLDARSRRALDRRRKCAFGCRSSQILGALLDISKLESARRAPDRERGALAPLPAAGCAEEFQPIAREAKGLELRVHPLRRPLVESDPAYLRRILQNLMATRSATPRRGRVLVGCGGAAEWCGSRSGIPGRASPRGKQARTSSRSSPPERPRLGRRKGWGWAWPSSSGPARCSAIRSGCTREVGRGTRFSVTSPLGARGRGHRRSRLMRGASAPGRRSTT